MYTFTRPPNDLGTKETTLYCGLCFNFLLCDLSSTDVKIKKIPIAETSNCCCLSLMFKLAIHCLQAGDVHGARSRHFASGNFFLRGSLASLIPKKSKGLLIV